MAISLDGIYAFLRARHRLSPRFDPVRPAADSTRRRPPICAASVRATSARPTCCAPAARTSPQRRWCSTRPRRRRLTARGDAVPRRDAGLAGAAGAFFGHLYPVWLRFRGGKGVATFLGGLIGAFWPGAIVFALVWLATAASTRYSSAAALAASLAAPLAALALGANGVAAVFGALALLLWIKHSANIGRLIAEPKRKSAERAEP